MDAVVISDPYRSPIPAQRKDGGGVVIRTPKSALLLSESDMDRVIAFVGDEPRLGQLQRFQMGRTLSATESDE